ncbi:MAG TPA: hypothetical protein VLD67_22045 [Vicinamibacterales bacterium]|nr:hypothetical protein [Vicinamibacterales bacterium]
MADRRDRDPPAGQADHGLRRLLTWTFIALALVLVMTMIAVSLVMRWFGA